MHTSEWLTDAKNVPVGQKRRVYHGAEPTAALDVYNNIDSWSAYCHRCKQSGYVRKQMVAKASVIAPIKRKYLPSNLVPLSTLHRTDESTWRSIVLLLFRKGVSVELLSKYNPMYSPTDCRLVFKFAGVNVGRDVTELNPSKWFVYANGNPKHYVYLQNEKRARYTKYVAVVEDLFSAIKIHAYTGLDTLWMMGTNFKESILECVMDSHLIVFTDGDKAGQDCSRKINNVCDLFDIPCEVINTRQGYDPKDYTGNELREVLKEYTDA